MRRRLELLAVLSTTLALVATSRAPEPCASETVTLRAEGTCGEAGTVGVNERGSEQPERGVSVDEFVERLSRLQ